MNRHCKYLALVGLPLLAACATPVLTLPSTDEHLATIRGDESVRLAVGEIESIQLVTENESGDTNLLRFWDPRREYVKRIFKVDGEKEDVRVIVESVANKNMTDTELQIIP